VDVHPYRKDGQRWIDDGSRLYNLNTKCTPSRVMLKSGPKAGGKHQIPIRLRLTLATEAIALPGSNRAAESTHHKPPCHRATRSLSAQPEPVRRAFRHTIHHAPRAQHPGRESGPAACPPAQSCSTFPSSIRTPSQRRGRTRKSRVVMPRKIASPLPRRPRPRSDGAGRGATNLGRFHARSEVAAAPATRREQSATEVPSAHPRSIMAVRTKSLAARLSRCFLHHYFEQPPPQMRVVSHSPSRRLQPSCPSSEPQNVFRRQTTA
jgi:hypothetical protein